ncbi:MAG: acetyl-CoA carboxylase biotin carboxyl carrier protein [Okeania sp. SIO2C2]|uniref:acetyl-CoA carboxylase biotin carboxyl carrier protein n=1 Tax=Okeania sp. SIO2C2 TaxID=2607787 RepID=UPI0013BCFD8B|nr:acetyl-CoA carboxylase biotin carboxyl carrier protein [Okeania sp. SIO2C2]NEP90771.1 acetyl-CoA carboxylase biotin carboxyl carrier protein [Okeania sp. SIO2C2]
MQLDLHQLRELLTAIDQTNISELTLKSGDLELTVRKGTSFSDRLSLPSSDGTDPSEFVSPGTTSLDTTAIKTAPITSGAPPTISNKFEEILSPVVGTFYRAPAPDEPPFVEVGDRITSGQTVCIIEAMKVMNEIEAEVSGQIVEILIENGQPVEYNQPLMLVNPN